MVCMGVDVVAPKPLAPVAVAQAGADEGASPVVGDLDAEAVPGFYGRAADAAAEGSVGLSGQPDAELAALLENEVFEEPERSFLDVPAVDHHAHVHLFRDLLCLLGNLWQVRT